MKSKISFREKQESLDYKMREIKSELLPWVIRHTNTLNIQSTFTSQVDLFPDQQTNFIPWRRSSLWMIKNSNLYSQNHIGMKLSKWKKSNKKRELLIASMNGKKLFWSKIIPNITTQILSFKDYKPLRQQQERMLKKEPRSEILIKINFVLFFLHNF